MLKHKIEKKYYDELNKNVKNFYMDFTFKISEFILHIQKELCLC